jgi:hypothetical protein
MNSNDFNNFLEFKKKYNELITLIHKDSGEDKLKVYIENVSDEDLELLINKFCKNIETDKKLRKLFLNRNEKLFSDKNNIKIIPSFNLKTFLSKCEKKEYIWECIQLIYAIYRTGDIKNKDFISRVVHKIEENNYSGTSSNEANSNPTDSVPTNKKSGKLDGMIMDIADTLRNNLVNDSKSNSKVNPIENMLKTSQMISNKYGNDLKEGKISMSDMFDSLGRMMGEIDKKTSNDDELKNIDVSDMPNPDDLMKNLGLGGLGGTGGTGDSNFNPMDMLSSLMGKETNKDKKDLTPGEIKEMDEFYSKMSTSDINITKESNDNKQLDLSSMLKSMTNMSNNETSDVTDDNDNKLDLSSILKSMTNMSNNKTSDVIDITDGNVDITDNLPLDTESVSGKPLASEELNNIFKDLNNTTNNSNMGSRLDEVNKKLIAQLPEDKQKEIKSLTENMLKMMSK